MNSGWKWYVYIIECQDDSCYTGITWKPEIRYEQHLSKFGSRYIAKHCIKKLSYLKEHNDLEVTRKRERQIKNWSRDKKEKLIKGNWSKEW